MTDSAWSAQDHQYMAEAIQLAKRGLYTTNPNPRVGCVLVKDDRIVGSGWHVRAGEGHAEVNALRQAGDQAKGATAYVTLEPCSHYGRTPPCAEGLIAAGVSRVVAAMQDPNPQVAGRGFQMLRDAGIEVKFGLMSDLAEQLNPGFCKRMRRGLPFVRVKMAVSVDGRTAMASGQSQWITGPAARSDVQRLRARSSAVVSGISTVSYDNAALSVRSNELGLEDADEIARLQPLRVVLDSNAALSLDARLLESAGEILWVVSESASVNSTIETRDNVEVLRVPEAIMSKRQLKPVFEALAERNCNEVLLEAGATLAGEVISQKLADELVIYMAPKLMGSEGRPLANLPFSEMKQAIDLQLKDMRMVGDDIRLVYTPFETGA